MTIPTRHKIYFPREVFAQNRMAFVMNGQENWLNEKIGQFCGDWERYVLNLPVLPFNQIPYDALNSESQEARLFRLGLYLWAKQVGHPKSYANSLNPAGSSNQIQLEKQDGSPYRGSFTENYTQTVTAVPPNPKVKGKPQFKNGSSIISLEPVELLQILRLAVRGLAMIPSITEMNALIQEVFKDNSPSIPYVADPMADSGWTGQITYHIYNISPSMIIYMRVYPEILPAPCGIEPILEFS